MTFLLNLITAAVLYGTPLLYGTSGEILTEKSGNLNLGVPGIMYLGGIAGLAASFFYEFNNPDPSGFVCLVISLLAAFAASALGGLLYSFLTITLRANQNVTGLTLTIFGGGVANFFGGTLNSMAGGVGQISVAATSAVYRASIHSVTDFGVVGRLLLNYGFMVYLAIVLAVVLVFTYQGFKYVGVAGKQISQGMEIPMMYMYGIMPVCGIICAICVVIKIITLYKADISYFAPKNQALSRDDA